MSIYSSDQIDPRIYDLYDEYCHSPMIRREFLDKAAAIAVVSGSGLVMAQTLLPFNVGVAIIDRIKRTTQLS